MIGVGGCEVYRLACQGCSSALRAGPWLLAVMSAGNGEHLVREESPHLLTEMWAALGHEKARRVHELGSLGTVWVAVLKQSKVLQPDE
jgi:hypothetical protein